MGDNSWTTWATARVPAGAAAVDVDVDVDVDVNGFALTCATGADEPSGATPFGLLAASLSSCTVLSVRRFLATWLVEPDEVEVHVAEHPDPDPHGLVMSHPGRHP